MTKRTYLACPYTHPEAAVREFRAEAATITTSILMLDGHVVFSPITHGHAIAEKMAARAMPKANDRDFWMKQCLPMLRACDELAILPLPGWRESHGLWQEIRAARMTHLPIICLEKVGDSALSSILEPPSAEEYRSLGWFGGLVL